MSIERIGFDVKIIKIIPYCPLKFHVDWNYNKCYLTYNKMK